jgi:hypothetical protein
VKTRLLFIVLSASVLFASWGGKFASAFSWADGS